MAYEPDKNRIKLLVEMHQQKIFAFALYLIGGDKNKAYDIAATGFAEAFRSASPFDSDGAMLDKAARIVVERCRSLKTIPSFDDSDFKKLAPEKRGSLRMVRAALQAVPFDERALILLRDQLHFSYKDIAAVLGGSEKDTKMRMTQARARLRKEVEGVITRGG
jgi:RNA polymerase sigma-70 factor (ECF subfamily)